MRFIHQRQNSVYGLLAAKAAFITDRSKIEAVKIELNMNSLQGAVNV